LKAIVKIKGRVQKILDGWKERFLSKGGNKILIKTVIQAIPTYSMSIFLLPKQLCSTLNGLINRFLCGHQHNNHRTAWVGWEKLDKLKKSGGLGFRNLEVFNVALLAICKAGVEIVKGPEFFGGSNSSRKVLPERFFLTAQLGRAPSLAWRSIHSARGVLERGLRRRVGNGKSIHIWGDKWLPSSHNFQV
jgi:hypothetical protein